MTRTSEWTPESVDAALSLVDGPLTVLAALQAVQEQVGHVPDEAIPVIAARCNASRADVYGVLTFYSDLRTSTIAETQVRVCLGEACQSVGARELHQSATRLASPQVDVGHVYCLGNCALGPSAEVDGRVVGRVTPGRLASIVGESAG